MRLDELFDLRILPGALVSGELIQTIQQQHNPFRCEKFIQIPAQFAHCFAQEVIKRLVGLVPVAELNQQGYRCIGVGQRGGIERLGDGAQGVGLACTRFAQHNGAV